MKTWLKGSEWQLFARCGGDIRFITGPEKLSEKDADEVQYTCHRCPVRAECISHVVEEASSGVWCASRWINEVSLHDTPRAAKRVLEGAEALRVELAQTIPEELKRRGEF